MALLACIHDAFCSHACLRRGGAKDVNADERIAAGHDLMAAPVDASLRLMYPELYALHDLSAWWLRHQRPLLCCALPHVDRHG